jgi:hypothetical protein
MRKTIGIGLLLLAVALPALAQWQQWRLSSDDQQRYDSYFARWQEYRQNNDRDQVRSMEKRMMDIYARYNIPMQTPFWRVASNARSMRNSWRGRLSPRDQEKFDSYFSRWQDYRRTNNREQVNSMEGRMQDIYRHYRIPSGTPYFQVASNSRDDDWDAWDRDRWRGRLSGEDQRRFDSYYGRWVEYRRVGDRSQMTSMERRMYDVMQQYEIPQQVPFEQIASR